MAEQVRDPFRILHIGLTPWYLLDVLCVRHHNLQRSFQNRVDRLQYTPVLSMATWVQPSESNHSRRHTSSRAVVPNVRICFWTFPSRRTINKQATTVAPDVRPIRNRVRSEFA